MPTNYPPGLLEEVARQLATGKVASRAVLAERFNCLPSVARRAVKSLRPERKRVYADAVVVVEKKEKKTKKGRPDVEAQPVESMTSYAKRKFEAAVYDAVEAGIAKERKRLKESFSKLREQHEEKIARADKILASFRGVMSYADFRKIRACLHPDVCQLSHAAEMLQLFSSLEEFLVKPNDTIKKVA